MANEAMVQVATKNYFIKELFYFYITLERRFYKATIQTHGNGQDEPGLPRLVHAQISDKGRSACER